MTRKLGPLTPSECEALFNAWCCPDCGAFGLFIFGPRALDLCVNIWCGGCGAGFNASPRMRHAERIARRDPPADLLPETLSVEATTRPRWQRCADPSQSYYQIIVNADGHTGIRFQPCGVTSYHTEDMRQRYCALCHARIERRYGGFIAGEPS